MGGVHLTFHSRDKSLRTTRGRRRYLQDFGTGKCSCGNNHTSELFSCAVTEDSLNILERSDVLISKLARNKKVPSLQNDQTARHRYSIKVFDPDSNNILIPVIDRDFVKIAILRL